MGRKREARKPGKDEPPLFLLPGGTASLFTQRVNPAQPKPENVLLNLVCNLVAPSFVLIWLSKDHLLGPVWGLIVALVFPVGYGSYDLATRKKTNFLSVVGFISVLLSGSLTLLKVGAIWFAVKDAVLPTLIGLTVLASLRSKTPLIRELFYNDQIIDLDRVDAALNAREKHGEFENLLRRASIGLALTFIASAPVGFALARSILTSPPGTPEFNAELGKMHWLMPLVIAVPSVIAMMIVLWRLINGLVQLTGLTTDEILKTGRK
jgi:hypothetical protein